MRLHAPTAALAACLASAHAFRDTSPFILFSSSPVPSILPTEQLQTSNQVVESAKQVLRQCSSSIYHFMAQPSISSAQLETHAPHLRKAVLDSSVKGTYTVREVVGLGNGILDELVNYLEEKCGAREMVGYEREAEGVLYTRREVSSQHHEFFTNLPETSPSYTVIYTTTAPEEMLYEAKFEEPVHMDLKRQMMARIPPKTTTNDTRPLFEKYQFFTPGIFMGILVTLVMLALLSVGLNAISSLQVSYGAFEKEMGPAAQKKP